jgi:ATP-dependent 26S proteasome regulatory subunit
VFVEDVDSESRKDGDMRQMLEAFDGITAKHTDIIAVLTTNHPDKIHPGMLRPGRMDAVVTFAGLDKAGVEALFTRVTGKRLADEIDWAQVHAAVAEFPPAYLKEVANRAVLFQTADGSEKIETDDLVAAAHGLRDQLNLMRANAQPEDHDTLSDELRRLTMDAAASAVVDRTKGQMVPTDAGTGSRSSPRSLSPLGASEAAPPR